MMPTSRAFAVLSILLALGVGDLAPMGSAWAAGVCGNGIVESGEECDPGGDLHCDGNPSLPACSTGSQCLGGVNCYFAFGCCKFNCQFVGQGASCFDGSDCTTGEICDNVGRCVGPFVPDGSACDDGTFCNGEDTCQTGECVGHGGDPCGGSTDCQTTCNEATASCESTPFVPCGDDGNACTDDVCDGSGNCTHPPVPAATVCRAVAGGCDVAETCAGGGTPCPGDSFLPDGTACGDQCTTNGTCQDGTCVNGVPLACDDDDVCNGLETCDPLTGCVPGTPLDCGDGNGCTADQCDPSGGCSNPVVPDGGACDDEDLCTAVDRCVGGLCQGENHAFVAEANLRLGPATQAEGHLAVNDPDRGVGKLGSFVFMADGSSITANVVILGKASSVYDVFYDVQLRKAPTAVVRGGEFPATLPLGTGDCSPPEGSCGGPAVVVPEGEVVRLTPGSYGNVNMFRRGTLELDPGEFDVCAIATQSPVAIRSRGDVTLRVHGDVKLSRLGLIEPLAGALHVTVAGKANLGTSSVARGVTFNVPDSRLKFGRLVEFNGSACAESMRTSRATRLGCPAAPPPVP